MKKKKKTVSAEEQAYIARKTSFQEHLPITDIEKGLFVDKEGNYFPIFEIGERSIALMDEDSLLALLNRCEATFETLDLQRCQFLSLPIPFDIEPYLKNQKRMWNELQLKKKDINYTLTETSDPDKVASLNRQLHQLDKYMEYIDIQSKHVEDLLHGAEIINKKSFMIPLIRDSKNKIAVEEAARNIAVYLGQLAPASHRCNQQEMQDVLFNILNAGAHTTYHAEDKQYTPDLDYAELVVRK